MLRSFEMGSREKIYSPLHCIIFTVDVIMELLSAASWVEKSWRLSKSQFTGRRWKIAERILDTGDYFNRIMVQDLQFVFLDENLKASDKKKISVHVLPF